MSNLATVAAQMSKDANRLAQLEKAAQWIEAYGAKERNPKDDLSVAVHINRGSSCVGSRDAAIAYEDAIMRYWPEVADHALSDVRAEIEALKAKYAAVLK